MGGTDFQLDSDGHQVSFVGPGIAGTKAPVLLPLDRPRLRPAKDITLPVKIYNPRGVEMKERHGEVDHRVSDGEDYERQRAIGPDSRRVKKPPCLCN